MLQSEVSVITIWEAFSFTKQCKWYYKVGLGITEWHNFYYKMGGGVFQSGAIITKKSGIVQKDSDISVLEPQFLRVKLL